MSHVNTSNTKCETVYEEILYGRIMVSTQIRCCVII